MIDIIISSASEVSSGSLRVSASAMRTPKCYGYVEVR
jgi:hypothetical protein